jgi:hypothetical protein
MRINGGTYFKMLFAGRIIGLKYSNFNIIRERSSKLKHFLSLTIVLGIGIEQNSSLT